MSLGPGLPFWTETCTFSQAQHWDSFHVFFPGSVSLSVPPTPPHPGLPVCRAKIHFQQEISIGCSLPSLAFMFATLEISCPLLTAILGEMGNFSLGFYILGPGHPLLQWILGVLFSASLSANSTLGTRHKHARTALACPRGLLGKLNRQ